MAIKKSQDAKFQLHVWNRLLEGRIALQKILVATNEWEKATKSAEDGSRKPADEDTIKSVTKLLTSMVRLRDTYRSKSQFRLAEGDDDHEDNEINPEIYSKIDDSMLDARHNQYDSVRSDIIEKWYEKTKIGTIPKKGYVALELPTLQLISNALKDKDRLIRKTQIDRTSPIDTEPDPEVFNDDDFYHHLLKEVISKDDNRKWAAIQRLRYKGKRQADTKATKGRKIKKDLIQKLVNFMAPVRPVNQPEENIVPEQIRDELVKSLFGGSRQSA